MNYDLALQLKEAGFPFRGPFYEEEVSDNPYYKEFYPALSELIEACGDEFKTLLRGRDTWECYGATINPPKSDEQPWDGARSFSGSTPEESVAKLWLALNKK